MFSTKHSVNAPHAKNMGSLTELLLRRKCGHHTRPDNLLLFFSFFFNDWSGCCCCSWLATYTCTHFPSEKIQNVFVGVPTFYSIKFPPKIYWKIPFRGPSFFFFYSLLLYGCYFIIRLDELFIRLIRNRKARLEHNTSDKGTIFFFFWLL